MTDQNSTNSRARLVILISGSGDNLQAILDAIAAGKLNAEIVAVISNRKAAFGLVRAAMADVPSIYVPLKQYRDRSQTRQEYDADLAHQIHNLNPDLIVLARWMHVLSASFINRFPQKIINLHPALPGQFPGAGAIKRAFAAYRQGEIEQSGCIVHYVTPDVNEGPVIVQTMVPFRKDDSEESFAKRIHEAEQKLIVEAIAELI